MWRAYYLAILVVATSVAAAPPPTTWRALCRAQEHVAQRFDYIRARFAAQKNGRVRARLSVRGCRYGPPGADAALVVVAAVQCVGRCAGRRSLVVGESTRLPYGARGIELRMGTIGATTCVLYYERSPTDPPRGVYLCFRNGEIVLDSLAYPIP